VTPKKAVKPAIMVTRLQAIVGFAIAVLTLLGLIGGNYYRWKEHVKDDVLRQQREGALCGRVEQVAATFVKYYPAETSSLYYPNAKDCP
jgi:hypothetical protein